MRVVVAQTSFLGDVVLTTPVFAALKRQHPDWHVTVWVRPEGAGVLAGHPHVDAVLADDKRGVDRGLRGLLRMQRRLREQRFDLAIALHKSARTALLLATAGIPRRIGFRQSAGWFLYTRCVVRDPSRHDVLRNLSILAALGIDPAAAPARLLVEPPAPARAHAAELLRATGIAADPPVIGLAPGSAWATKRWTVSGYAELARRLVGEGYAVVLLGAPSERAIADDVNERAGGAAVNLVGRTDVATLAAVIDRCGVLVCNDSAPMHIAVAREVPVIALFGPTHPDQGFAPYTDRAVVLQRELACRPCGRHGAATCPVGTHECMTAISVDSVLAAVRAQLATAPVSA